MIRLGMFLGDRYEILEKIGSGGMADVFKGKDHKLNRLVAVKVLKDEFVEDRNFVRKFKEEAQAAAALAHPNIVNVYDVGEEQNVNYIVMELVEGITLKNYIERKGRLTVKEATSIGIQVSAGLEVAHNNNIIHRDIKPQNIIISRDGKVKVTDFGIAKSISSHTTTSDAMGSVHYTSPEQARGGYSDAKSDIYSLGIVLYEMVTGRVPFDGDTTVVVAVKHLQEEMTPPSVYAPGVPVSLEQIILKCTEKSPDRRYQNIGLLIADLKQSLLTPDANFVVPMVAEGGKTVAITRDDISQIRRETGRMPYVNIPEEPEYDEDEDYGEEYDEDEDDGAAAAVFDDDEDGILDPQMEKIMIIGGIIAGIIILIIIIVIIFRMFAGGGKSNEPVEKDIAIGDVLEGEKVEVPDLTGMSYSEAQEALFELNLDIAFGEAVESSDFEEGQIVGQDIEAGEMIEPGQTVTVDICSGGKTVAVPNVVGESQANAEKDLKEAGFSITVKKEFSDTVKKGNVMAVSPSVGSNIPSGSVVTITVSDGKKEEEKKEEEKKTTVVPEITGRTEARAKEKLAAAKLSVGSISYETSDSVEEGYVISQSVAANSSVAEGTAVNFVVSKGKKHTHVYEEKVVKEPTCQKAGSKQWVCSCGDVQKTEEIPKSSSHSYGSLVIDTAPTCAAEGSGHKTCSVCGDTKTETISKTSSHGTPGPDGKCPICGAQIADPTPTPPPEGGEGEGGE